MNFRIRHWSLRLLQAFIPGACAALIVAHAFASEKPVFTDPIDEKPMATPLKPGEKQTPALEQFKETGTNIYRKDPAAIQTGKTLYEQWCAACHGADATGKMGPSLVGGKYTYPQAANDVGMFSIIYGGAFGAMQAFSKRDLSQDEMLKIIAYIRSIDQKR